MSAAHTSHASADLGVNPAPLIAVDHLAVTFTTPNGGTVEAVRDVSFTLHKGKTLGIVGESGSGKSQTALAMMGLLPPNGKTSGSARYDGRDLLGMKSSELNRIRGDRVAMIFQDPMTALNPFLTIERQMTEVLQLHRKMSRKAAFERAVQMCEAVRIADARRRIKMYPHEFSGGMLQRVMIAMALLCEPDVLIADEPTTALDVTVQAQIIELLRELQRDLGTAIILITHDMGVVASLCDDVMVMYGGRTMEYGTAQHIFEQPTHPYTIGLLDALPHLDDDADTPLRAIAGNPPSGGAAIAGCAFAPRCAHAQAHCNTVRPELLAFQSADALQRLRACHLPIVELQPTVRAGGAV
jgi:oligopeptide transport system ATP-binding protein